MKNELKIALADFKLLLKRFRSYERMKRPPRALFAFSNGMLSVEADADVAVVHAEGEWHGRASISSRFLGVLHLTPPKEDPVVIRYADDKLRISTLILGCDWETVSAGMLQRVEDPDLIDLLALDRTVSRAEIHGTDLGKRISQAKRTVGGSVTRAANLLEKVGITPDDLWTLVEARVRARIA